MFTTSETSIISLIVLGAVGILGWGFYRAKPFGKLGILAWLQSVVITPGCYFWVVCCWDLHQCGHPVLVGGFGWVIHLAGQSTQSSWSRCGVARTKRKARKFHPVSKSNRKYTASSQLTKPAQSPLNVDVVPIRMRI